MPTYSSNPNLHEQSANTLIRFAKLLIVRRMSNVDHRHKA